MKAYRNSVMLWFRNFLLRNFRKALMEIMSRMQAGQVKACYRQSIMLEYNLEELMKTQIVKLKKVW